ncbi:acyl transferase/acyl hydrolase/lysophospholipase [Microdochium bolleyi]|uniref:Acyl transferase/acyl hydrolase/lysophospholipase n=1 Tax=Microdochium bolleyi TaxID=196109 RepID=A0A136IJ21_9PEZI|nr:acyl transferase/acyl hydrolase/lysophospholipase [Microdochium bolleyi]
MAPCEHSRWVGFLRNDDGLRLEVTDSPQRVLHNLPRPDTQKPLVLAMVGSRLKAEFLSSLRAHKSNGRIGHVEVALSLWPGTTTADCPALFMDANVFPDSRVMPKTSITARCHESRFQECNHFAEKSSVALSNLLGRKAVLPFADVICIFVSDTGGISHTGQQLASWARENESMRFRSPPWLILVVERASEADALDEIMTIIKEAIGEDIPSHFAGIRVMRISSDTVCRRRQWPALEQELEHLFPALRERRDKSGHLFTARHLTGLLHRAAHTLVDGPSNGVDLIQMSRIERPLASDHHDHMLRFIRSSGVSSAQGIEEFLVPIITSSLILDHYPPGMHNFRPQDVFETLYQSCCDDALNFLSEAYYDARGLSLITFIQSKFIEAYQDYLTLGSAKRLHLDRLYAHREKWQRIRSNETCLCCLRRQPKYWFVCGHSLCENCVEVFSDPKHCIPFECRHENCVLCSAQLTTMTFALWPKTAGVRVLSIDGGGICGRISLEFLRGLQDSIGLPIPVQSHFDLVFGTSAGAVIACALCVNGWEVDRCIVAFEELAKQAFKPRLPYSIPLITKLLNLCLLIVNDCRYSAENLEASLQAVFGLTTTMLQSSKATEMGIMVGVSVTTTSDVECQVFSNYNGIGTRKQSGDYFAPRHVNGYGTFQDGGLMYNNPASLAIREVAALFPTKLVPSTLLSIGTGSSLKPKDSLPKTRKQLWKRSFVYRVSEALKSHLSPKRSWQQLESHWKVWQPRNIFRFDIDFKGPEPSLDDVSSMPRIAALTNESITEQTQSDEAASCIRAEMLLFELDERSPYVFDGGVYKCQGRITYRLDPRDNCSHVFIRQLYRNQASFFVNGLELPTHFSTSLKPTDQRLSMSIQFSSKSRSTAINILLRDRGSLRHISGSPLTLQRLLEAQNLENWFGNSNHRERVWAPPNVPERRTERPRRKLL